MGLRAKLVLAFFLLLSSATAAVGVLSLDRALRVMTHGLLGSGERVAKETFEQMRGALVTNRQGRAPAQVLRGDRGLRTAMQSSAAFGEYVVYVRIVAGDGTILISSGPEEEGQRADDVPGVETLAQSLDSRLPLSLLPALWTDRTYESTAPVELDGKPFGSIRVGLSTGLIATDVHRLAGAIVLIASIAIALSLAVALALGNQMLRPVLAITSGVEQLAAGRADVNLEVEGPNELGTLADKFNQLSQRVRSERAEWQNERGRLVDVFRSASDAILLLDAEGSLLFANDEAIRRLGLSPGSKSEGKPLRLLLDPEHPLIQLIGPALEMGSDVHDVGLELGSDPDSRVLASIFPLGQGPTPAGLLVILRNLARIRELETVVDYSNRLARLAGLLSGIAHQIRGPLNAMTMQLELMRQDGNGDKHARRIDRVRHEIRRLDGAIEALLRFMRPQELKIEPIALDDLLRQVGGRVHQPNVTIEYEFAQDLPSIRGDRGLISEALQNIANNGAQAMPQGGVLKLKASQPQPGLVEIDVEDRGVGIPEQDRERIFDLYYTTKEGGSGLGLPLALRAIDLHHGSIKAESPAGGGTIFRIRLPVGEKEALSSQPGRAN